MNSSSSNRIARFSRGRTCPVCGGSESDRRGQGTRCHGFVSQDGEWVHCSREEHAGRAKFHQASQTYSHKVRGPCPCGVEHAPAPARITGRPRKIVERIYPYEDARGEVLFEVVRYKDKTFAQRRPLGNGRYAWDLDGIDPVLFDLPAILAADRDEPVWIPEGEKDVQRLKSLGLTATCNPMGAGNWRDCYSDWLGHRVCFIIPDNDGKGRDHAQQVAASLRGKAALVKVVELPDLPEKGDVSDFLDQGHTVDELRQLAEGASAWSPPHPNGIAGQSPSANGNGHHSTLGDGVLDYAGLTDEELGLVGLDQVKMRPIEWLWDYRLARGEAALMAGEGGIGKSLLLLATATPITTGSRWPDGTGPAPLGQVLIVSAEDSPETTILPRMAAMGADVGRVKISKAKLTLKRDGRCIVDPQYLQDRRYWSEIFDRIPGLVLFIVDPLPSYLGRGVDDQKNSEIRAVLEPFIEEVLRPRHVCMLANTHLNKSVDARAPVHRITGSIAYVNIPRNVHVAVRDPDRPERRYLKQCKCNNAPDDLSALAFTVEKRLVPYAGGEIETAIPVFEDQAVNVDLHSLLNGGTKRRGPKPIKTDALAVWLFDYLTEHRGPVQAGPLHDAAAEAFSHEIPNPLGEKGEDGLWTNGRNLKRAADRIPLLEEPRSGKRVERFRDPESNRWYWQLVDIDASF